MVSLKDYVSDFFRNVKPYEERVKYTLEAGTIHDICQCKIDENNYTKLVFKPLNPVMFPLTKNNNTIIISTKTIYHVRAMTYDTVFGAYHSRDSVWTAFNDSQSAEYSVFVPDHLRVLLQLDSAAMELWQESLFKSLARYYKKHYRGYEFEKMWLDLETYVRRL